ncbi:MAG: hypothetical protein PUJ57_02400 [Peptoniphilaceae bacterium]|nr:hypothetical protein [Peptoniphilaceae bacterium]MDD7593075.1 hypothetical protein [Peptoniphilaceae bacterium]MDY5765880.1 hypothetical protein [Peptoniphilaceae bacterium]
MTTAHYLVTVHLNIDLPFALLHPEPADAPTGPEPEAHACIYVCILERCAPIPFAGKNFQAENAGATKQAAKDIVNRKSD